MARTEAIQMTVPSNPWIRSVEEISRELHTSIEQGIDVKRKGMNLARSNNWVEIMLPF